MKPQEEHTRTLRITEMKLEVRVWIIIVFLHLLVCKVNYDDTDDQSDGEEEETNTTSNDYTDDATNHMSKKEGQSRYAILIDCSRTLIAGWAVHILS